jgi:phosphate transport system protein
MDLGISSISETLTKMGDMAQKSLEVALESYFKEIASRKNVFELSEKLKSFEDQIGDIAVELVAQYQPVATDLRFIRASMEIAYLFWRCGRYSYDIADTVEEFGPPPNCDKTTVREISSLVLRIFKLSLGSLHFRDETKVIELYEMDSTVDTLYRKYLREVIEKNSSNSNNNNYNNYNNKMNDINSWNTQSKCVICNTLVLRFLERISDHACYLGDCIFYLVLGASSPRK